MKAIALREDWLRDLTALSKVLPDKETLPELSFVRVEAADKLRLVATDGESQLAAQIATSHVAEAGTVMLPLRKILKVIRGMKENSPVTVEQSAEEAERRAARLLSGSFSVSFSDLPLPLGPTHPPPPSLPCWAKAVELLRMINQTEFCLGERGRWRLDCAELREQGGALQLAAASSDRVALSDTRTVKLVGFGEPLLLSGAAVTALRALVSDKAFAGEFVSFGIAPGDEAAKRPPMALFAVKHRQLLVAGESGLFPPAAGVLPKDPPRAFTAAADELKEALTRIDQAFDYDANQPYAMFLFGEQRAIVGDGPRLRIVASRDEARAEDAVALAQERGSAGLVMNLSRRHLLDVLDLCAGRRVRLECGTADDPVLVTAVGSERFRYVVMPGPIAFDDLAREVGRERLLVEIIAAYGSEEAARAAVAAAHANPKASPTMRINYTPSGHSIRLHMLETALAEVTSAPLAGAADVATTPEPVAAPPPPEKPKPKKAPPKKAPPPAEKPKQKELFYYKGGQIYAVVDSDEVMLAILKKEGHVTYPSYDEADRAMKAHEAAGAAALAEARKAEQLKREAEDAANANQAFIVMVARRMHEAFGDRADQMIHAFYAEGRRDDWWKRPVEERVEELEAFILVESPGEPEAETRPPEVAAADSASEAWVDEQTEAVARGETAPAELDMDDWLNEREVVDEVEAEAAAQEATEPQVEPPGPQVEPPEPQVETPEPQVEPTAPEVTAPEASADHQMARLAAELGSPNLAVEEALGGYLTIADAEQEVKNSVERGDDDDVIVCVSPLGYDISRETLRLAIEERAIDTFINGLPEKAAANARVVRQQFRLMPRSLDLEKGVEAFKRYWKEEVERRTGAR